MEPNVIEEVDRGSGEYKTQFDSPKAKDFMTKERRTKRNINGIGIPLYTESREY